jgi:hypothetical protein
VSIKENRPACCGLFRFILKLQCNSGFNSRDFVTSVSKIQIYWIIGGGYGLFRKCSLRKSCTSFAVAGGELGSLKETMDLAKKCLACQDLAKEKVLLGVANSLAARLEYHRIKRESHGSTLKELLHTCRESLCTDQKDKVYALVGLASDCQLWELIVDYSKSLAQVYKDVIKLYSLPGSGHWDGQDGRDVVRFSYFL